MALGAEDRVLILGAGGWFGQTVLELLGDDVAVLGTASHSRASLMTFDGAAIREFSPTLVVNSAFLTRERVVTEGESEFTRVNRILTEQFLEAASMPHVRAAVTISSGAVVTEPEHPYGALKAAEESQALALVSSDRSVVVARAYSVSGPFVRRPRDYALSDFILQAAEGTVTVRASRPTFRRYISVADYMTVCIADALAGRSGVVESGGPMLEMGELAQSVVDAVNPNATIQRVALESYEPSVYASDDISWQQACARHDIVPAEIRKQIRDTVQGVLPARD